MTDLNIINYTYDSDRAEANRERNAALPRITVGQLDYLLDSIIGSGAIPAFKAAFAHVNTHPGIADDTPEPEAVHGFPLGATVYSRDAIWGSSSNWGPYIVAPTAEDYRGDMVETECGRSFHAHMLTTDISERYQAPPTDYTIYDGTAKAGETIWWWGFEGPEEVTVDDHDSNIRSFPNVYSREEPAYDMVRVTTGKGVTDKVKAYRYMQAPYGGNYELYQAAVASDLTAS